MTVENTATVGDTGRVSVKKNNLESYLAVWFNWLYVGVNAVQQLVFFFLSFTVSDTEFYASDGYLGLFRHFFCRSEAGEELFYWAGGCLKAAPNNEPVH